MAEMSADRLDRLFGALADPTRRAILSRLTRGSCSVSELAGPFDMSLAAVSKHIKVLERAELLEQTKAGRVRHCAINRGPLAELERVIDYYQRFWEERMDALAVLVEKPKNKPRKKKK